MSTQILRIIDANLNRTAEGLRVLEDIARFKLNLSTLSELLKTLRHEMVRADLNLNRKLLDGRDAGGDVGVSSEVAGESACKDLPTVIIANSRRVQESLRVLEEMSKIPESGLNSEKYKKARFQIYEIEQELIFKLTGRENRRCIKGLYLIIDPRFLKGRTYEEIAEQAIRGGARLIQLRVKTVGKPEILDAAYRLKKVCSKYGIPFIVNDHLDVALAADADGVHLGQDDLPVAAARNILSPGKIIGCSAATVEQAKKAEADGADYVAVGSIYATGSKQDIEVIGLEPLVSIKQAVSLPVVAIGGINPENVKDTIKAGADALAVISAVLGAADIEKAARQIAAQIEEHHE